MHLWPFFNFNSLATIVTNKPLPILKTTDLHTHCSQPTRPGYIYLFRENKEWNSSDNLKIFGKVWKFRAVQSAGAALNFRRILKICFLNKYFLQV
jgi:hypothetical protein